MLKMLDLFSGIGGFSYAAHMTGGIETIAFCEIEPYARKVLAKNYPLVYNYADINTLVRSELDAYRFIKKHGRPDIICGGFPCQPFSVIRAVDGRAKGTDDHRDLWPEMFRVIRTLRPTWVVGENVNNFANLALDRSLADLEAEGYASRAFVLPAVSVSAPHRRDRLWIVAHSERERLERLVRDAADTPGWQEPSRSATESLILSCQKAGKEQWSGEPPVCGVDDGVPDRLDRLRCLGNAIVPQVVYPIFQAIVTLEAAQSSHVNQPVY